MAKQPKNTEKPTEGLEQHGFKFVKARVAREKNIFDELAAAGAENAEAQTFFERVVAGLGLAVQAKRYRNEAYEPLYEVFYLGFLESRYPSQQEGFKAIHTVERFNEFCRASSHQTHPYCRGCTQTPKNMIANLAKIYVDSDFWTKAAADKRAIFIDKAHYQHFLKNM